MKQDKFLIGILVGIVLLVVVAVVVVLFRAPGAEAYLAENSPRAVVHNYYLALQRKDYERAYGYLADDLTNKPSLEQFILVVDNYGGNSESALKIGEIREGETHTQVDITITTYNVGNIFDSSRYSAPDTALLRQDAAGQWHLVQFPYPYWGWEWNQEPQD
jgi:hypothetical protein